MTRNQPKSANWRELSTADWNVTTFHAYLADQNRERFSADYVPFSFGQSAISNRWAAEKGALKQAQEELGNAVLLRFIDRCLDAHKPNANFPHINFGFMWTYKRDELPRAQADVARAEREAKAQADAPSAEEVRDLL